MTYEEVKKIRENPTAKDVDNAELARLIDNSVEKQIPKTVTNNLCPYSDDSACVCCGAEVPEGWQVCKKCENEKLSNLCESNLNEAECMNEKQFRKTVISGGYSDVPALNEYIKNNRKSLYAKQDIEDVYRYSEYLDSQYEKKLQDGTLEVTIL